MEQSQLPNTAAHPLQIASSQESAPAAESAATPGQEAHTGKEEAPLGEIPPAPMLFANSVLVAGLLVIFGVLARRKLAAVPKGFQNFAEFIAESLNTFTVEIIGPGGEKFTPLVGTVFLYILFMNLIGLIPGFHSPTANLTITLALGMVVFVFVQYQGIRNNGLWGYIKHFAGPMPALAILMLPVEIISEVVKPFTLAVRLFGNIFGEDVIMVVLAGLGATIAGPALGWIPFHFVIPVILLAVLTAFVQAMVFSILTCIYIALMAHHSDEPVHGNENTAVAMAHAGETSP